ncbi:hypothetical protein ACJX0J_036291, partial [Zea mays]
RVEVASDVNEDLVILSFFLHVGHAKITNDLVRNLHTLLALLLMVFSYEVESNREHLIHVVKPKILVHHHHHRERRAEDDISGAQDSEYIKTTTNGLRTCTAKKRI